MRELSLDILSVMGMDPLAYIRLAADLGCDYVGMQVAPVTTIPEIYPAWSLRDNPGLVRDIKEALADRGVSMHLAEGFLLQPGVEPRSFAADLDILAEVGARCANACSFEEEQTRGFDGLAVFAELAAERGMGSCIEFAPGLGIADLPTALEAVRHVGMPSFGIAIDAMHLFRSGSTVAEIAELDPAIIRYVQICDVPWSSSVDYVTEACFGRMCPGQGDLPLQDLVAALPLDPIIGIETPIRDLVLAGKKPIEVLAPCVDAARELIRRASRAGSAHA